MDNFVPSIGTINNHLATSPQYLSIYDQEKSDTFASFCAGSHPFKYTTEATSVEEFPNLDDKIEDSNLQTMFTPELMNTFSGTPSSHSSAAHWEGKAYCAESESNANLTLNEINMDNSDIALFDIFNYDTDDSKLSFPPLDLLTSEIKSSNSSSCHTPLPMMCVEPSTVTYSTGSLHEQDKDFASSEELILSNSPEDPKNSVTDMEMNYYRKLAPPMKANFPPREAQPPLIGIVTPVKKPELLEAPDSKEMKPDIFELKTHLDSYKNSSDVLKSSDCMNTVATVAYSFLDMQPQTVPSCKPLKRGCDEVKREPESPPSKKLCKNDNFLEDVKNILERNREDHIWPQRTRNDSGGSGHISDGADDDFMKDVYDSDDDDDYSDIDADITSLSPSGCESLIDTGKKQKQFFWQYNVQAKGPKGTRLKLAVDSPKDPHILNDFEDPVFDECNTVVAGIRHGGKARKGDGNEIAPNPRKLVLIGHQLLKLNKEINACQLGSDVPISKRNESRKEKNKLASRACRLKKKAQHEANKIKLHGLEEEHTQLNNVVQHIWPHLRDRVKSLLKHGKLDSESVDTPSLTSSLNSGITNNLKSNVAKATTDYVNSVILKVEAGDPKGGLNIHGRKS